MKATLFAVAAAMASTVAASGHGHKHVHAALHAARDVHVARGTGTSCPEATCDCSTVYYTTTGEPTRMSHPPISHCTVSG